MDTTGPYFKDKMKKKKLEKHPEVLNEEETEEFLNEIEENKNFRSHPKSSGDLQRAKEIAEEKERERRSRCWNYTHIRENMIYTLRDEQRYNYISDPVVCKADKWYFYDLHFRTLNGPFETELEARFTFNHYRDIVDHISTDNN